jgi:hypothetical protein
MAITTMNAWDVGQAVHKGEKMSDPRNATAANREFSAKSADDLQVILAAIVATLDEMKGQL